MRIVTIHAAKTKLSQLLAQVEAGEEVILARGKTPIAKLTRYMEPEARRRPGSMKGEIEIGPEFFEPLPEEELKRWE